MKQDVKNKKKSKIKQRVLLYFLSVFLIMLGACYPYPEAPQEQIKENNSEERFNSIKKLFESQVSIIEKYYKISSDRLVITNIPHILKEVGNCRSGHNSSCSFLKDNVFLIKGLAVGKDLANKKITLIEPGTIGLGEIQIFYENLIDVENDPFCLGGVKYIKYNEYSHAVEMESIAIVCLAKTEIQDYDAFIYSVGKTLNKK